MLKAFDCAQPLDAAVAGRAVAVGFRCVGRYYGSPGSGKLLTPREVAVLSEAGLPLWCYFERSAGRSLQGAAAGRDDARTALLQAVAVGQPEGSGICFAVDQDVDMDNRLQGPPVLAYFGEIKAQFDGRFRVGVYGDGDVCQRLVEAGLVEYEILAGAMGWQGSRAYRDARLWEALQFPEISASASPIGIAIDPVDIVGLYEVGAWSADGAAPKTEPAPVDPGDTPAVTLDQVMQTAELFETQLRALGLYTGRIDRQIGPQASGAAMRAYLLWHQRGGQ